MRKLAIKEPRFLDEKALILKTNSKNFAKKVAKVMLDLKSSHIYFILQEAYGEISWEACESILEKVIKNG
jgi:hypothetical protein